MEDFTPWLHPQNSLTAERDLSCTGRPTIVPKKGQQEWNHQGDMCTWRCKGSPHGQGTNTKQNRHLATPGGHHPRPPSAAAPGKRLARISDRPNSQDQESTTTSKGGTGPAGLHGPRRGDTMAEGEQDTCTNPILSVFQQVKQQENFRQEQKEDDRLKHCWAQVRQIEGVDQNPDQGLPTTYFLVMGGLLYYRSSCRGEASDLLVVPKTRTQILLHLAHAHPHGGHLGARNTLDKLKDQARNGRRGPGLLPAVPPVPTQRHEEAPTSTPYPSHHHRLPLREDRHGPRGAAPEILPGS